MLHNWESTKNQLRFVSQLVRIARIMDDGMPAFFILFFVVVVVGDGVLCIPIEPHNPSYEMRVSVKVSMYGCGRKGSFHSRQKNEIKEKKSREGNL